LRTPGEEVEGMRENLEVALLPRYEKKRKG